ADLYSTRVLRPRTRVFAPRAGGQSQHGWGQTQYRPARAPPRAAARSHDLARASLAASTRTHHNIPPLGKAGYSSGSASHAGKVADILAAVVGAVKRIRRRQCIHFYVRGRDTGGARIARVIGIGAENRAKLSTLAKRPGDGSKRRAEGRNRD